MTTALMQDCQSEVNWIPTLRAINFRDYTAFVLKHITTLKSLHVRRMLVLYHGSEHDLGRFYLALRESQILEDFH